MIYGSACSGIEAATVAWHPLGWKPAWFSEIEPFPCAVLNHHYPETPNNGDMTKFKEWPENEIDVLVGGTPCQSFSVAGLRKGLDDPRGNLMLTYLAIAAKYRPTWLVWENVPGVLSSNGGRDFGTFLAGLGELGYGFAYRILDAQYFGVAQRRRRVFVVGYFRDWRRAAAVLFERHSLSGDSAPSRAARKVAPTIPARSLGGGGLGTDFDCDGGIVVHGTQDPCASAKAFALGRNSGQENAVLVPDVAGTMKACAAAGGWSNSADHAAAGYMIPVANAVSLRGRDGGATAELGGDVQSCLRAAGGGGDKPHVLTAKAVRRLTPRECERLQGFPDGYTMIPWRNKLTKDCPDGPRYKALGNSMAVPVMRWIGERIQQVDIFGGAS